MVKQLYLPWLQIAGFSCYFIREGLVQIALSSLSLSLSLQDTIVFINETTVVNLISNSYQRQKWTQTIFSAAYSFHELVYATLQSFGWLLWLNFASVCLWFSLHVSSFFLLDVLDVVRISALHSTILRSSNSIRNGWKSFSCGFFWFRVTLSCKPCDMWIFLYLILCHCLIKSLSWLTIYYTCELWTFTWHDVITLETLALSRGFKFSKEHCLEDRLTCSVILNSFVIILFVNKKLCLIWMIYAI